MKITAQYRIVRYTHKFPMQHTNCFIQRKRTLPNLFKERLERELALESITNPFKMTNSWNFVFNDTSELSGWDDNVDVVDSKLILTSGTEGIATSVEKKADNPVTQVHLIVKGEAFDSTIFRFSTNGGNSYQNLSLGLNNITSNGVNLVFQIRLKSESTQILGVALLFK